LAGTLPVDFYAPNLFSEIYPGVPNLEIPRESMQATASTPGDPSNQNLKTPCTAFLRTEQQVLQSTSLTPAWALHHFVTPNL